MNIHQKRGVYDSSPKRGSFGSLKPDRRSNSVNKQNPDGNMNKQFFQPPSKNTGYEPFDQERIEEELTKLLKEIRVKTKEYNMLKNAHNQTEAENLLDLPTGFFSCPDSSSLSSSSTMHSFIISVLKLSM